MTKKWLPPLIAPIVLGGILQVLVKSEVIQSYLLPAPSDIFLSLRENAPEYLTASQNTLLAAALGLCVSAFLGIGFSILLSISKILERALYPYAVFFQTVPLIAIAPILVIWFGFGLPTVIASAVIASVFPIIANTTAGIASTDPALQDLFKLYGASKRQTLFKLKLKWAVPQIFTGLRIASGLSMIGAIVGEFIGGGGLGGLVDIARTQQRLDKVFAAVFIASFLGIFLVSFVNLTEKIFFHRWRPK